MLDGRPSQKMGGPRRSIFAGALLVAAVLVAALALHLVHTQEQGRAVLRESLGRRAALTGRLIGSAFTASAKSPQLSAQFGAAPGALAQAVRRYAAADPEMRLAVLDARGRVMASTAGFAAPTRAPHVAAALRGRFAISDELVVRGHPVIELAVPLNAPSGRRVLVIAGATQAVRTFADGFFASASAIRGAQGYLLDGAGRPL